jgi:murein DD-endopeptidase MepM/ murein hydrolase activator NlpD
MRKKIFTIIITLFVIMSLFSRAFAETISELENQKSQAQKDKATAQNQLRESEAQEATINDELETLNTKISGLNSKISDLETQIDDLNKDIDNKQTEITKKEKEIEENTGLLEDRLVALYKYGGLSYLDVVLGSGSYLDMITSYEAVNTIAEADSNLINKITTEKEANETAKAELETTKSTLETKKSDLDTQNAALKTAQDEKKNKVASLNAEQQALQKKIDEYNTAIRNSEAKIKAQQEAAKEKINNGTSTNVGGNTGGHIDNSQGSLGWPLPLKYKSYRYITSYFGPRVAPTYGASSNHGAIDIGIPTGTGVYAAESGYVVACGWYGGYGNYIRLWHKSRGELYTCYGHLSTFKVSLGNYVNRGDLIALSGSTGVSTGPHLHFEVRVGGSSSGCRVDPLNYLVI